MRIPVFAVFVFLITAVAVVPAFAQPPTRAAGQHDGRAVHELRAEKSKKPQRKKPAKTVKKAPKSHKKTAKRPVKVHRTTPTKTPNPTVVPTSTSTPTSTVTPTASPTATATPVDLSTTVMTSAPPGYAVAYTACGIPPGLTISFSPNPAGSSSASLLNGQTAASTTLTVGVPYDLDAGQYSLAIRPLFHEPGGQNVIYPSSGGQTYPQGVLINVTGPGQASLTALTVAPLTGSAICTAAPPGFSPPAPTTTIPGPIQPYAYVVDPSPSQSGRETVFGALQQNGHYLEGVQMHTNWYFPYGIESCDGVSTSAGPASCALEVGPTPHFYTVEVQVIMTYQGVRYTAYTSFVVA